MSERPPEPPDDDHAADGQNEAAANDEALGSNVILLPGLGGSGSEEERFPGEPAEGLEDGRADGELGPPDPHLLEGALEALLLAADGPVREHELDRWLAHPGMQAVQDGLHGIQDRLRRGYGGIRLVQVAKGWQLRTDVRFSPWVSAMRGGRPVKLSRAALETLSIVAYRQPVTRGEVENLRGVDSGGVLRMLCERGLVAVTGRADGPGRPLIYNTTPEFLAMFSLRDLSDLPTLRDLRELRRDDPREAPGGDEDLNEGFADFEEDAFDRDDDDDGDDDDGREPGEPQPAPESRPTPLPLRLADAASELLQDDAPDGPAPAPKKTARRQTSLIPPDPDDFDELEASEDDSD